MKFPLTSQKVRRCANLELHRIPGNSLELCFRTPRASQKLLFSVLGCKYTSWIMALVARTNVVVDNDSD